MDVVAYLSRFSHSLGKWHALSSGYYSFCTWLYGVSAEECVALADETLQKIQQTYPDMWQRLRHAKPI